MDPHAMMPGREAPAMDAILRLVGSPFTSERHMMLAAIARRDHAAQQQNDVSSSSDVPPGTIAVLVQDGRKSAVGLTKVKLKGVRKSIEEGDKPFEVETTTTAQGMAAFRGQETDTIFSYEVVVEKDGATYTSGSFTFEHAKGTIVSLIVYPVSPDPMETMIFTRALYVLEPKADVFQVQALYRIHNAGVVTWRPTNFPIQLPAGAAAFQPGNAAGVQLTEADGRVLVSGTFAPGQKEFTYSFQLPNGRQPNEHLKLPVPLNLVDAKVVSQSSSSMGLRVAGFTPAEKTFSPSGQPSLIADQDFLQPNGHPPAEISVEISGMPPKSNGAVIASALALLLVVGGIAQAAARPERDARKDGDRVAARNVLLDELVRLERAKEAGSVGPETYARTKRLLIDALARLEAEPQPAAPPQLEPV
jgi:hypothetical protein